jgi:hypothetical protein
VYFAPIFLSHAVFGDINNTDIPNEPKIKKLHMTNMCLMNAFENSKGGKVIATAVMMMEDRKIN